MGERPQWQNEILEEGELYLVGGVVRDGVMGGRGGSEDYDYVVTGIDPRRLEDILGRHGEVRFVGRSFGVYKFTPAGESASLDVAFPRRETSTGPGHKDFEVDWDWRLPIEADLERRDFTMNAMALSIRDGKLIDPLGGRDDIERRLVKMVFPEAFKEDSLRILRGIRFAARFEFDIDAATRGAMIEAARLIRFLSPERIQEELSRLLTQCAKPSVGFMEMHEIGVLKIILPELDRCAGVAQNEFHPDDVFMHSLKTCDCAPRDNLAVRWAALLHDVGKVDKKQKIRDEHTGEERIVFYQHEKLSAEATETVLKRLRYGKALVEKCRNLVLNHMFNYESEWGESAVLRFIRRVGEDGIGDLMALRRADCGSRNLAGEAEKLAEFEKRIDEVLEEQRAFSLEDLAIDGRTVMNVLGIEEGPEVGRILEEILEEVIGNPALNTRRKLKALMKKKYAKRKPL